MCELHIGSAVFYLDKGYYIENGCVYSEGQHVGRRVYLNGSTVLTDKWLEYCLEKELLSTDTIDK